MENWKEKRNNIIDQRFKQFFVVFFIFFHEINSFQSFALDKAALFIEVSDSIVCKVILDFFFLPKGMNFDWYFPIKKILGVS